MALFLLLCLHLYSSNFTNTKTQIMPSGYIDFENNRAVIAALKRDGEVAFDAVYRHYYRGLCVFC